MSDVASPKSARIPRWPLAAVRIYLGVVFGIAGFRQLTDSAPWVKPGQYWPAAAHDTLIQWLTHTPSWYHDSVARLLPHTDTLAPLVAWLHLLLGVALVLGVATRLIAAIAFLLLCKYMVAAGTRPYSPGPIAAYAALALTACLGSAGRVWGVDGELVRRWRRDPTQPIGVEPGAWDLLTAPGWVVVPLRLYLGAAFLSAASNKVGPGKWDNWPMWMVGVITGRLPHVVSFYRPFLTDVVVPHVALVAPAVAVAEISVGVLLLLGGATRVAALVGIVLTANYFLLDGMSVVDVSNDAAFVAGLCIVIVTAAGRVAGLDSFLVRLRPRSKLW